MFTRILSASLLFLLSWTSSSCTTKVEEDPKPQPDLVGRWQEHSWNKTQYDEKGAVVTTYNTSGTPNYYVFNADKTFTYYSISLGGTIAGSYTYQFPSLTMAYQAGTFRGEHQITEFTPSKLVLTGGQPQPGMPYTVEILTLVKE